MAGAGFKTFATGEVLTASDVNTYLMQQTVMVFASSTARSTALGANVAEGMLSYLKDTKNTEYYNGSAWVVLSTGGDITGVTAGTGLTGGGTSGDVTLSFDQSNYGGGQYAAGKNKFINGDFGIWQRGTSFSTPTSGNYTADRFIYSFDGTGGTRTVSQQTFTPGTAPVAGYEGSYYWRLAQTVAGTGGTYNGINQRIEDVRTFAGQTVTFSFWAKADASRNIQAQYGQVFGTGGSTGVYAQSSSFSLTTSWQRFSWTVAIPSISGKTIGTNSFLEMYLLLGVNTTQTIDLWGWQIEAGSTATPFQTATGTKQGELAACQRYLQLLTTPHPMKANGTTTVYGTVNYQTMRSTPTLSLLSSNPFAITDPGLSSKTQSSAQITIQGSANDGFLFSMANFTSLTSGTIYYSNMSNSVAILASAEL